nr:EamA family transporter [Acinetobacter sp. Marseille-Q1620]
MSSIVILVWIVTILIDTFGQLAFKAAASENTENSGLAHWKAMAKRPWIWIGITCYIVEFVAWLAFLSLVPLSDGVMLGSINIVVIMIAGRLFFKEKLSKNRLIGVIFITIGVTVVGMGA